MNRLTGRNYGLFDYYGDPEADRVIIAMGSVTETIKETIDHLRAGGEKVGLVAVILPSILCTSFPRRSAGECPQDCRARPHQGTRANGEPSTPMCATVSTVGRTPPMIIGGRYGLSSKDTTPAQILEVYRNPAAENTQKRILPSVSRMTLPTFLCRLCPK